MLREYVEIFSTYWPSNAKSIDTSALPEISFSVRAAARPQKLSGEIFRRNFRSRARSAAESEFFRPTRVRWGFWGTGLGGVPGGLTTLVDFLMALGTDCQQVARVQALRERVLKFMHMVHLLAQAQTTLLAQGISLADAATLTLPGRAAAELHSFGQPGVGQRQPGR